MANTDRQHHTEDAQKVAGPLAGSSANDADETTLYARETVRIAIEELLKAWPDTPALCKDFLYHDWQAVLLTCYRRFGRDSQQWHSSIQLAQDLLWLAQRPDDEKSLQRLPLLIPDCCDRIVSQLDQEQLPKSQWQPRLAEIRAGHHAMLQHHATRIDPGEQQFPDNAANDDGNEFEHPDTNPGSRSR